MEEAISNKRAVISLKSEAISDDIYSLSFCWSQKLNFPGLS